MKVQSHEIELPDDSLPDGMLIIVAYLTPEGVRRVRVEEAGTSGTGALGMLTLAEHLLVRKGMQ